MASTTTFKTGRERLYDANFHQSRDANTRTTAQVVLSYIFGWAEINAVCDVGCGVGTWLSVAGELGAKRLKGYEGTWAEDIDLVIDSRSVVFQDLEKEIKPSERFDLVISLEVAEHLSRDRGPCFVSELCRMSDLVLFSAAIPNQGGTGHVNERWQSYWASQFEGEGYCVFDPIRPKIWNDFHIPWWYRQNTLLYVRAGSAMEQEAIAAQLARPSFLDLVHPELLLHET